MVGVATITRPDGPWNQRMKLYPALTGRKGARADTYSGKRVW